MKRGELRGADRPYLAFRGVTAAASLKPELLRCAVNDVRLPRRHCRGLIEAARGTIEAVGAAILPRRHCRGLIEAMENRGGARVVDLPSAASLPRPH